jgi:hypothetical protein
MVLPRPSARAAKVLPLLGAVLNAVRTTNLAVPAATVTGLVTLTLTEGAWWVQGWASILMGAGAGKADLYLSVGGGNFTVNLAAAADASGITPPSVVVVPTGATQAVTLNCFANAACTAQWAGGPAGLGNAVGIRAVREG